MSTHVSGFQSFPRFLHHFVLAKLATSSIRVKVEVARPCVYSIQMDMGQRLSHKKGGIKLYTLHHNYQ